MTHEWHRKCSLSNQTYSRLTKSRYYLVKFFANFASCIVQKGIWSINPRPPFSLSSLSVASHGSRASVLGWRPSNHNLSQGTPSVGPVVALFFDEARLKRSSIVALDIYDRDGNQSSFRDLIIFLFLSPPLSLLFSRDKGALTISDRNFCDYKDTEKWGRTPVYHGHKR